MFPAEASPQRPARGARRPRAGPLTAEGGAATGEARQVIGSASPAWLSIHQDGPIAVLRIGDEIGCNGQSAVDLLREIDGAEHIGVVVNSVGRDMEHGLAVADGIRGRVTQATIFRCFSSAVPIAMAAPVIHMASDATLMIHSARRWILGNGPELECAARGIQKLNQRPAKLLRKRTGQAPELVAQWLSQDSYFTPQQALDTHLVDAIIPPRPCPEAAPSTGAAPPSGPTDDERLALDVLRGLGTIRVRSREKFMRNLLAVAAYQTTENPNL